MTNLQIERLKADTVTVKYFEGCHTEVRTDIACTWMVDCDQQEDTRGGD